MLRIEKIPEFVAGWYVHVMLCTFRENHQGRLPDAFSLKFQKHQSFIAAQTRNLLFRNRKSDIQFEQPERPFRT